MRTTIRFPVPAKPWSVNELTHTRQGGAIRTKQKNKWRDATMYAVLEQIKPKLRADLPVTRLHTVQVSIPFTRGARRDPHNYTGTVVKVIIDAMTKTGIWPDDDARYVRVLDPILYTGTEVIVTIEPCDVETNP